MLQLKTPNALPDIICPRDGGALDSNLSGLKCRVCNAFYPVVQGIPILIADEYSVFAISDYQDGGYLGAGYGKDRDGTVGVRKAYRRIMRSLSEGTVRVSDPIDLLVERVLREAPDGPILVVGAGDMAFDNARFVYTDVSLGEKVNFVCDAHNLPFGDGVFAAVIMVAVLEHVVDPNRCVAEAHRVLMETGIIYADTPFLQPVHMGAYDFTRFTYLGHRRLFRWFDTIDSGVSIGPAAALGHSISYTLRCMAIGRYSRLALNGTGVIIAFIVRQLDRLIGRTQAAYDAAGGNYFIGRSRLSPITDREMISLYRGRG